jgi:spore maturation protein CgeB
MPGSNVWFQHFYGSLSAMGHEVLLPPFDVNQLFDNYDDIKFMAVQRAEFSEVLVKDVRAQWERGGLHLFMAYLYNRCIDLAALREISQLSLVTVNFSCNNVHQFDTVNEIAPEFAYCWVPEREAVERFRQIGARPVHIQMGANPELFRDLRLPRDLGATFVGSRYMDRGDFVKRLVDAGTPIRTWGPGWCRERPRELVAKARRAWAFGGSRRLIKGLGRRLAEYRMSRTIDRIGGPPVDEYEMVRIFNRSKITLSFSKVPDPSGVRPHLKHIRLRDFEAPMCGVFYLTEAVEELQEYYVPDREIVCFSDPDELVDKTRFYLRHERARDAIRVAGMRRALAEHTWQSRFSTLFREIGLG